MGDCEEKGRDDEEGPSQVPFNKAGYTASDAPRTRLREGVPDLPTDRRTDGPTDRRTDGRTHPLIEMRRRI